MWQQAIVEFNWLQTGFWLMSMTPPLMTSNTGEDDANFDDTDDDANNDVDDTDDVDDADNDDDDDDADDADECQQKQLQLKPWRMTMTMLILIRIMLVLLILQIFLMFEENIGKTFDQQTIFISNTKTS